MGVSIENCFAGDWVTFPVAFIGAGFPSAPASVEFLDRPDSLVGSSSLVASGVFFLFTRFGDVAVISEVDEPESSDEDDLSLSVCLFMVSAVFDSVLNFSPLIGVRCGCVNFPSVRFPVAFLLIGLSGNFFRVNFTGSPIVSSRNIGCCGALRSLISKKRKHCPVLRNDLYAT